MGLTIDQLLFYYADAIQARLDYMLDVRAAVWGDQDGFGKYIGRIVGD
jgi:hypothetical protein